MPTLANAFSLAASHSGGIMEYANTGGNIKRLHAGLAAMGGVRSALLSKYGWTGPPTAIEGKRGFCHAFAQDYSLDAITAVLGKEFWCPDTIIKAYCCNANLTPVIDAVRAILAETSLKPEEVEAVEVYIPNGRSTPLGVSDRSRPTRSAPNSVFTSAWQWLW